MSAIATLKTQLESRASEFKRALPANVSVDKFLRVVQNAVLAQPDLLEADRASLFMAASKCAADGLMPDGREAALTTFKGRATYMPMMAGILKKVRNSGELRDISAYIVRDGDTFEHFVDEHGEHVSYRPNYASQGAVKLVFAVARTKEDGIYVEVMTLAQIEQVRSVSRARDGGPWKTWWEEMAKKTAIRRLSKRLPMSTDLDDMIRRDDELYDPSQALQEAAQDQPPERPVRPTRLASVAPAKAAEEPVDVDPETGEVVSDDDIPI